MAAALQNFSVFAGDDRLLQISIVDSADQSAVELAGAVVAWKLARVPGGPSLIEKDSTGPDVVILTPTADGKVEVQLQAAETGALEPGSHVHQVRVTDSAGEVTTVLIGTVTVEPTIQAPDAPTPDQELAALEAHRGNLLDRLGSGVQSVSLPEGDTITYGAPSAISRSLAEIERRIERTKGPRSFPSIALKTSKGV